RAGSRDEQLGRLLPVLLYLHLQARRAVGLARRGALDEPVEEGEDRIRAFVEVVVQLQRVAEAPQLLLEVARVELLLRLYRLREALHAVDHAVLNPVERIENLNAAVTLGEDDLFTRRLQVLQRGGVYVHRPRRVLEEVRPLVVILVI